MHLNKNHLISIFTRLLPPLAIQNFELSSDGIRYNAELVNYRGKVLRTGLVKDMLGYCRHNKRKCKNADQAIFYLYCMEYINLVKTIQDYETT